MSHEKRGFIERDSPEPAAGFSRPDPSPHPNQKSLEASRQELLSSVSALNYRSSQDLSVLTNQDKQKSDSPGKARVLNPAEDYSSGPHPSTTINSDKPVPQPASTQADRLLPSQNHRSNPKFDPHSSIEGISLQPSTQVHPSFSSSDRQQDNFLHIGQPARSLKALTSSDGRSPRAFGQSSYLLPSQNIQRLDPERHPKIEHNTHDLLAIPQQSSQVSILAHRPSTPKDYVLPRTLLSPDALQTASFNLQTNRWDSDLPGEPESSGANMSARTPANTSSRVGPSQTVYPSQDVRNPYAIVTTTKAGRPYTNPYMPIDPPSSTSRYDDLEVLERQNRTRYNDQEEARSQALDPTQYRRDEGPLDDPFQDQYAQAQQYGHNQPSNYSNPAAHQAASMQLTGNRRNPAPSSLVNTQQPPRGPNTGLPTFHDSSTRASVRLPAVRGTTEYTGRVSYAVPIRDPAAHTSSSVSSRPSQARTVLNDPHQDRNSTGEPVASENAYHHNSLRPPAMRTTFAQDAVSSDQNAELPALATSTGNLFMELLQKGQSKRGGSQQRLEDVVSWFRSDPRDLSYAAAVLPYETMNKINREQFPIEDGASHVGRLADDSQDDDPSDRARQATTPRPIGHGRPAGFITPPSIYDQKRHGHQPPQELAEAMFGGVYCNLMAAKTGPYDYMNHYSAPPPYAIDHNARNNDTLFDPQWFATAPPARVGRDRRREQGEYEDPTLGSANRRGDLARGDVIRRDSGGRGGSGMRGWGSSDVIRSF